MEENTKIVTDTAVSPSFLNHSLELEDLFKDLGKASKSALKVLLEIMKDSKDEGRRMQAALKVLELQVSVADKVSADQIQRLIAEYKFIKAPQGIITPVPQVGNGEGPQRVRVDFKTIKEF